MADAERDNPSPEAGAGPDSKLRRLGKYELIARIGKGGMAEVYLARQRGLMDFEKIVVVKTIHPHLAQQKDFIDMLLDEARIAARIEHPNVVDIYDLGCDGDTYFIAMEHLAGQPLLRVLRAGIEKKPLDVRSMARIISDVADGLHAAHELKDHQGRPLNLVHRDVTPGNIVILYNGRVKILDFGIAKASNRISADTGATQWKGKLAYMAPEYVGGMQVDRRSDIFSLGVVMWEALALRRLFKQKNPAAMAEAVLSDSIDPPSRHRSGIPRKLDSICMRALARDPDERYSSAAEMQEALERFLSAAAFQPQKNVIAKYMQEMFADEISGREDLLRDAAEATSEIQLSELPSGESDLSFSGIAVPPAEIGGMAPPGDPADAAQPAAAPRQDPTPASAQRRSSTFTAQPGSGAHPSPPATSEAAPERPQSEPSPAAEPRAGSAGGERPDSVADWYATDSEIHDRAANMLGAVSLHEVPRIADTSSRTFVRVLLGAVAVLAFIVIVAVLVGERDHDPVPSDDVVSPGDSPGAAEPEAPDDEPEPPTGEPEPGTRPRETIPDVESGSETQAKASGDRDSKDDDSPPTVAADPPAGDEPAQEELTNEERQTSARALYEEGIDLFMKGQKDGAEEKFRAALDVHPDHADSYRGLGTVYENMGKVAEAVQAYRAYLRLSPKARDAKAIRTRLEKLGE